MIQFAAFERVDIGDHAPGAPLSEIQVLALRFVALTCSGVPDRLAFASCKLLSCGWWGRTHGILDMIVSAEPLEVRLCRAGALLSYCVP